MSDANRTAVYIRKEAAFNEAIPATPTMDKLRLTSDSIKHDKETVISDEILEDRNIQDLIEVGKSASGDLSFEFNNSESLFDYLVAAIGGTKKTFKVDADATNDYVLTDGSPDSLDDTEDAGIFEVDGDNTLAALQALAGRFVFIKVDGADNGGYWMPVDTVTDATNLPSARDIVAASQAAQTAVMESFLAVNGSVIPSYQIRHVFEDISQELYYTGMRFDTFELNVVAKEIVTGDFSLVGASGAKKPVGITVTESDTQRKGKILTASTHAATLKIDGADVDIPVMSISLSGNNNLRERPVVGSEVTDDHGVGRCEISGTMEVYFKNVDMWNKFYDHQDIAIDIPFFSERTDDAGTGTEKVAHLIHLPRVSLADADPDVEGVNSDVMQTIEFTAQKGTGIYDYAIGLFQSKETV